MKFDLLSTTVAPRHHQRTLLTLYSTLDVIACLGMLALLAVGVRIRRLRSNLVLLNFELVIFFTAFGQTMLTWTGHPFDLAPPFGLCLTNSAWVASAACMKAGAAFGLTCKVWAHTMSVAYPNSKFLRAASSGFLLLAIPWLCGLVLLLATVIIGTHTPTLVRRSSIYYCLIEHRTIGLANMGIAIILQVFSLVFAIWTAGLVSRVRRRLRSMVATSGSPIHYSLIIRTLIFAVALAVALGLELVVSLVSITAPVPGMVLACVDFTAFIIFATDPILLRSMVRRIRGEEETSFATGPTSQGAGQTSVSIQITRSGPIQDNGAAWIKNNRSSVQALVLTKHADLDTYSLDEIKPHKKMTTEATFVGAGT